MKRFHIFQDGKIVCSTVTKEDAIDMIREYQKRETHPILRSEFSYIEGEEVFVPYEQPKRSRAKR